MHPATAEHWSRILGDAEYELAASYLDCIEPALLAAVPDCGPLTEVALYMIAAGGRRIRPLVALAVCGALGGKTPDATPGAVAAELVHTASLIHDDILDRSTERRGRQAAHLRFGTNLALLTGDMLYFAAVEAAQALCGAVSVLNAACNGMCLGEVTKERIESARLKSGALFRAAAEIGALAAGVSQQRVRSAGDFGEKLGTAYQLRDDELDGEQNASPLRFADEARSELAALPASSAKELLVQLTRFAWRRSE